MSEVMKYDVCVVGGCGHVGLPLAICFAKEKKRVAIVDVDEVAISKIQRGEMPFKEETAEEALREVVSNGRLSVGKSPEVIAQSKTIVVVLGTPVSAHLYPLYSDFFKAIRIYLPYFRNGQLIVLRSTIFPGTAEKIDKLFRSHGLSVDVAFCPERIAEGFALREIYELPQIISSFTEQGLKRSREFFSVFTKDIIELTPMEAELAKLFTNVWRYTRFAIANQFFMIANSNQLDFYKIHAAMTYKYPRAKDLPKAGFAAGPCLFKDTMQLAAFGENNLLLGHAAMLINEGLPAYLTACLKKRFSLENKTIGILGMAFKAESDDSRESLSFKLRNVLGKECKEVLITDPYVKDERLLPVSQVIEKSDILVLGAPHQAYAELDLKDKPVIDIWNFFGQGALI